MRSPFEDATKVALEEIILEHAESSKFGYFLSRESVKELTEDLFHLLKTSRSLKAAGDKLIGNGPPVRETIGRRNQK